MLSKHFEILRHVDLSDWRISVASAKGLRNLILSAIIPDFIVGYEWKFLHTSNCNFNRLDPFHCIKCAVPAGSISRSSNLGTLFAASVRRSLSRNSAFLFNSSNFLTNFTARLTREPSWFIESWTISCVVCALHGILRSQGKLSCRSFAALSIAFSLSQTVATTGILWLSSSSMCAINGGPKICPDRVQEDNIYHLFVTAIGPAIESDRDVSLGDFFDDILP